MKLSLAGTAVGVAFALLLPYTEAQEGAMSSLASPELLLPAHTHTQLLLLCLLAKRRFAQASASRGHGLSQLLLEPHVLGKGSLTTSLANWEGMLVPAAICQLAMSGQWVSWLQPVILRRTAPFAAFC